MVSDISKYKSHPNKKLSVHIEGVLNKVQKRTSLKIAEISAIFHDLGKINPHFQKKLNDQFTDNEYSKHSYLSVYSFLCFGKSNPKEFKDILKGDLSNLWSIVAIIAHHHGNLPNFNRGILNETLKRSLEKFILTKPYLPFSQFLNIEMEFLHEEFSQNENSNIFDVISFDNEKWKENALINFMQTQFAFAALIEADKRDAAELNNFYFDLKIENSVNELSASLSETFEKFKSETPLNKLRTEIRIEAVKGISEALKKHQEALSGIRFRI